MPFKKLIEPLKDILAHLEFSEPLPLQKQIISTIKSGSNLFIIAPDNSGKTTSLVISVIQKLKLAFEDSPRALIFVKDKEAALHLENLFNIFKKGTDLRVYSAYDEHNIDIQRDDIYYGLDIVIATPTRLNKLFYLNGINLNELKICIVEDAQLLFGNNNFNEISRTPESMGRCQYIVFSNKFDERLKRWGDTFMYNAKTLIFK